MKHLALALSIGAVILTAGTTAAMVPSTGGGLPPPPLDHMVCYTMKDPLKIQSSANFLAQLQPEFTQDGCILLKPIEFCVPASKLNVTPAPPNPNIGGAALSNDYICYKAKCPNVIPPPDKVVIDQFGERLEQNYKLTKICVPARKRSARCPVGPIVPGGAMCQGACPLPTQLCKTTSVGGVKTCQCVGQTTCTARPDAAGQCGGTCPPDATTGRPQLCLPDRISPNPTAKALPLVCNCQPPPNPVCGINELTGQCGGKCQNPTDQCVFNAAHQCTCEPVNPPCQATSTGTCGTTATPCISDANCPKGVTCTQGSLVCGGDCTLPGQTCQPDATTGKCSCNPPNPCSQNSVTGLCGGDCLDPKQLCTLDSTGHCTCQQATACGSVANADGTSTCAGPCPKVCLGGDRAGTSCTSDPDCTGVCNGGHCLNGTACTNDFNCSGPCGGVCKADATGACNCQSGTTPDPCLNATTCPVPCPGNQQCSIVPGTNVCRCQCDANSCGTTCPAATTCSNVAGTPNCACQ